MITATFLALSGVVAPQPQADMARSAADAFLADTTLVVDVQETRFTAQSHSDEAMLLVFKGEDPDLSTVFWLHAGARYEEEFSRGTLAGLRLDVLYKQDAAWRTTGALTLPGDSTSSSRLWVLSTGHALYGGGEDGGFSTGSPDGSFLSARLQGIASGPPTLLYMAPSPRHVPVQTPTDKPRGDKPPKLEKKPLPVV